MTMPKLTRALDATYDEALVRVPEALKAQGFGVLTEIDVQKTLEQKLGVPFRRYRILGACNPPFAHRALSVDLAVGLMLPCNVVVYETDEGRAMVLAVDPTASVGAHGDPELVALATAVKERLSRALESLG